MTQSLPPKQSLSAKKAESNRPHHGESILEEKRLSDMFGQRARDLLDDVGKLVDQKVVLDPFLEIGAGSTQRSTALINNYKISGVATDISQKSLQDSPYILKLLNYNEKPILICCDAHSIPFLPNTFQFVFAYQTIHHFQNPIPVVAECHRVLAKDGHFFFNEEPADSALRRFMRGNRLISDPLTPLQKLAQRLGVIKLFWDSGAVERSLGMTEARFDFGLWQMTLAPFEILDIEVNQKIKIHSNLRHPRLQVGLSRILGGNIRGLCIKRNGEPRSGDFRERLMCLDCQNQLPLKSGDQLVCEHCGRVYPITDGVIRMLPKDLEVQLHGTSPVAG